MSDQSSVCSDNFRMISCEHDVIRYVCLVENSKQPGKLGGERCKITKAVFEAIPFTFTFRFGY